MIRVFGRLGLLVSLFVLSSSCSSLSGTLGFSLYRRCCLSHFLMSVYLSLVSISSRRCFSSLCFVACLVLFCVAVRTPFRSATSVMAIVFSRRPSVILIPFHPNVLLLCLVLASTLSVSRSRFCFTFFPASITIFVRILSLHTRAQSRLVFSSSFCLFFFVFFSFTGTFGSLLFSYSLIFHF